MRARVALLVAGVGLTLTGCALISPYLLVAVCGALLTATALLWPFDDGGGE